MQEFTVIHSVSRTELIECGDLVDVTASAREVGLRFPMALSRAVMADCVTWGEAQRCRKPDALQDETGRLFDVLHMAYVAARRNPGASDCLHFQVCRVPVSGPEINPCEVTLKLCIGPGDQAEPVLTVLMPDED
jgi:hypothetical protein